MTTRRTWIKIYVDKWLRGTIRDESLEVKGGWIDILALAGDSAYGDEGKIQFAKNVGYTDYQLASIFKTDLQTWLKIKKRLTTTKRIKVTKNNVIFVLNWGKYQSEYSRQKPYREKKGNIKLQDGVTTESNTPDIDIDRDRDIETTIPQDFLDFSKDFHIKQQKAHPNLIKKVTDKMIEAGAKELDKLMRIDNYNFKEIKPVLEWAIQDDFWTTNILSLASIRRKGKNGQMKFVNIFSSYERRNTNQSEEAKEIEKREQKQREYRERQEQDRIREQKIIDETEIRLRDLSPEKEKELEIEAKKKFKKIVDVIDPARKKDFIEGYKRRYIEVGVRGEFSLAEPRPPP